MSLSASYVSATSFTVSTDKTSDFPPGRAVYCDCGVDGIKYAFVSYSAYSDPNTTVTLESTDSQAITSNLASVLFSRVSYKDTGGNIPVQSVWVQRGFKSGMTLSWKDADEIYVDSGALHIDNGTAENIYCAQGQLTKQLTSLSASTWYAIYVDPPDNGLTLAAADIEYSSTMPGYVQAKRGWYHGTNTDWRCIGFVYANGSSEVQQFASDGKVYRVTSSVIVRSVNGQAPSNTFTTYTISAPIGPITVLTIVHAEYINTANTSILSRDVGSSGAGVNIVRAGLSGCTLGMIGHHPLKLDSSKQVQLAFDAASSDKLYVDVIGYEFPQGL